jgi:hypothetical protein
LLGRPGYPNAVGRVLDEQIGGCRIRDNHAKVYRILLFGLLFGKFMSFNNMRESGEMAGAFLG